MRVLKCFVSAAILSLVLPAAVFAQAAIVGVVADNTAARCCLA